MKIRLAVAATGAAIVFGVMAGVSGASATPPSDPPPAVSNLVTGTLHGPAKAKKDGIQLRVRSDTTVRSFTFTYPPGSFTGWHQHPGIVIALVESGTVVRENADCSTQTFTAGQAFIEVGPHFVSNPGTTEAKLRITHLLPAKVKITRTETEPPNCSDDGDESDVWTPKP